MHPKIFSKFYLDLILVICPIWISIIYILLINLFPNSRPTIFFIYLILFGELHFASTWLFFSTKNNREWYFSHKIKFIAIPLTLVILFILIGIINLSIAVFLASIFSALHVTRQSIGIFRLFNGGINLILELGIYILSALWLIIGFCRLILPSLKININLHFAIIEDFLHYSSVLSILGLIFCTILFLYSLLKENSLNSSLAFLTGALLYSPYTFVNEPQDAVAIGVGMHWCQYIALTSKIYLKENYDSIKDNPFNSSSPLFKKIFLLFLYAIISSAILTNFGTTLLSSSILILFPLSFQIYHFYIDSFIWRFSNPYLRKELGAKLFS